MSITQDKLTARRQAANATPSDLGSDAVKNGSGARQRAAGRCICSLHQSKNFHWHMSGPHFRDYHLLLDEQAGQIFAMTDDIGERVRKIGGTTIRSIGHVTRLQRLSDNDADYVDPLDMVAELREGNRTLRASMLEAHGLCGEENDAATTGLTLPNPARQFLTLLRYSRSKYITPMQMALGYMAVGKQRKAVKAFAQARRESDPLTAWLHLWPVFEELRSSEEFQRLIPQKGKSECIYRSLPRVPAWVPAACSLLRRWRMRASSNSLRIC